LEVPESQQAKFPKMMVDALEQPDGAVVHAPLATPPPELVVAMPTPETLIPEMLLYPATGVQPPPIEKNRSVVEELGR
jgi:hypothetical protein